MTHGPCRPDTTTRWWAAIVPPPPAPGARLRLHGGKITWHGTGQLVAYAVHHLSDPKDVRLFVEQIGQALMALMAEYGIADAGATTMSVELGRTIGPEFTQLKSLVRGAGLNTVCEEAGSTHSSTVPAPGSSCSSPTSIRRTTTSRRSSPVVRESSHTTSRPLRGSSSGSTPDSDTNAPPPSSRRRAKPAW